MKKIFMSLLVLLLLVSQGAGAFAHSNSEPTLKEDCDCGDGTNITASDVPDGITVMSNKEIKKIAGKLHRNKEYKESLKWFKESGLEISDLVAGLHMEELVFENGKSFSNINHIAFNGISSDKKTRGLIVAIIDNETNELLHLKADIFYNISEDGFESMQTYTPGEGIGEKITKKKLDQAKEGEFSTLGFSPCVHASVWICIYHCGMWALINGIAGVTCSAICGYAFAYACS
ncbi:putative immunity/bacteriocin fusion bifunctional protein (plasmid) [Rossellomorea sp. AcN35-11]|nr:hypothetical protein [Rossellomorea aquimaris]WJV31807.1 putative immunity/bacteriocin fusion bifunctional protein [Rossellomorea sp. AcN35-11]